MLKRGIELKIPVKIKKNNLTKRVVFISFVMTVVEIQLTHQAG